MMKLDSTAVDVGRTNIQGGIKQNLRQVHWNNENLNGGFNENCKRFSQRKQGNGLA